jgi:hypothetical protein
MRKEMSVMKYIRVAIIFEPYLCSVSASFGGKRFIERMKILN